jgi:two-component system OmpR family sensor kinase
MSFAPYPGEHVIRREKSPAIVQGCAQHYLRSIRMDDRWPPIPQRASERERNAPTDDHRGWEDERATLIAAVRARDEFISIAGHELRNPMAAVLLHVQALRKVSQRGQPIADLSRRLGTLEQRVKTFITRATTLLDVTRLNADAYRLEHEPVSLKEVLEAVIDELRPQLDLTASSIEARIEPNLVGHWDRLAIFQIASNLLSNAVKYGAGNPILVEAWHDDGQAWLRVEDHGIGLSEDDQQRVFAKFERAVKRRQHGGFGLGLWIVGQLVLRLGGEIEFTSAIGRGSTFTVRLPLSPGPQQERRDDG